MRWLNLEPMAEDKKEGVTETNGVTLNRDVLIERDAMLIDVITMMKNWELAISIK